jgi:predicted nucleic acid-binding protein
MLIDTSGWLCLYQKDEPQNKQAIDIYDRAPRRITHNYILAEFVPLGHARGFPREKNLDFARRITDSAEIEVIWVNELLHRRAVDLLVERPDKRYSLCDAVSFIIIMRDLEITDALTTDRHFVQEGFVRLLEP